MVSRRTMLTGSLLAGAALRGPPALAADWEAKVTDGVAALERRHGGRLGVAVLDTSDMRLAAHRGDERFALCSTFKLLAAAFVLARVDRKQESLDRRIVYAGVRLLPHSPTTGAHPGAEGLTVGELCEAAVTLSDNTAANLLLDGFGGPAELTAYLRSLGDDVTRLDRREPELNYVAPGDPRDTTTPSAMLETVRKTVLGTALSPSSRERLAAWIVAGKTGDKRLRAGVPGGWLVGDKTGTGPSDETNDVAVLWPPGRAPVIVTAYYNGARASDDQRDAVLAQVGRLAAAA